MEEKIMCATLFSETRRNGYDAAIVLDIIEAVLDGRIVIENGLVFDEGKQVSVPEYIEHIRLAREAVVSE
jgi:hypothetical protein